MYLLSIWMLWSWEDIRTNWRLDNEVKRLKWTVFKAKWVCFKCWIAQVKSRNFLITWDLFVKYRNSLEGFCEVCMLMGRNFKFRICLVFLENEKAGEAGDLLLINKAYCYCVLDSRLQLNFGIVQFSLFFLGSGLFIMKDFGWWEK